MTLEHRLVKREKLLNKLKDIQRERGYLPENKIKELSKKIGIPVVEIYSAATFYSMLSVKKKGKKVVRICNSPSCYLNGSVNILEEAKKILGVDIGGTKTKIGIVDREGNVLQKTLYQNGNPKFWPR